MTNDLMQKLLVSKKIMDRHKEMPRGQVTESSISLPSTPLVEDFQPVQGSYNIPQEYMSQEVSKPVVPKSGNQKERILGSKLPDSIKRLMIEHPIDNPNTMSGPTLSDDLIERASRLMGTKPQVNEQSQPQTVSSNSDIKKMVKEAVREILSESGLITESTEKSNDVFTFRVGKHLFEGKLTKIKKMR